MNNFFTWLTTGNWSYKYHKANYRDSKFNRDIDIIVDYISQIPYFKLIGSPIAFLIILGEWSVPLAIVSWEMLVDKAKTKFGKNKQ